MRKCYFKYLTTIGLKKEGDKRLFIIFQILFFLGLCVWVFTQYKPFDFGVERVLGWCELFYRRQHLDWVGCDELFEGEFFASAFAYLWVLVNILFLTFGVPYIWNITHKLIENIGVKNRRVKILVALLALFGFILTFYLMWVEFQLYPTFFACFPSLYIRDLLMVFCPLIISIASCSLILKCAIWINEGYNK
jgi:hypothetical protein